LALAVLLLAALALIVLLQPQGEDDLALGGPGDPDEAASERSLDGGPSLQATERAGTRAGQAPGTASDPARASAAGASQASAPPASSGGAKGLQLRVDVVHVLEGTDEPARWNLYPGPLDGQGRIVGVAELARRRTDRKAVEQNMVAWAREFRRSGEPRAVKRKSTWTAPPIVLEGLRSDLTPWDAPESLEAEVAADAELLVVRFPVGPMAPLDVTVNEDGRALAGADRRKRQVRFVYLAVGGAEWPLIEVVEHAPALLRVLGIPHRAGEPVAAHVTWLPPEAKGTQPADGLEPRPAPNLRTTIPDLPPDGGHPWRVEVPSGKPLVADTVMDELSEVSEVDNDAPAQDQVAGPGEPRGELRLRVHGHDGRRLTPRELEGQTLDEEGRIVRKDVPSGELHLRLTLPGRLPIEQTILVPEGQVVEADLHEPHGASLEVFVVDDLGRARPGATVFLPGRRWFDVDGPTQRIDHSTDHLGRRQISRVEPGRVVVHATWGSRSGWVQVELEEDHLTRVTIVAR
jgi:hypothetical protein